MSSSSIWSCLGALIVAEDLANRAQTRKIPIIVVTGMPDPLDEGRFAAVLP